MKASLSIKGIFKSYNAVTVLENIQLEVQNGDIYTLIGKNGVGKTTLLELLVGLSAPDQGEVAFNHNTVQPQTQTWKKSIGVALTTDHLIETLSIKEYQTLLGSVYGLSKETTRERAGSLIQFFYEENENINKPIKAYSSGMKKKALLCAAFIHNPEILFLDEPFTFLDPAACSQLCEFLNMQKDQGKIIILSSHDLLYVDKIATRIGILDNKRLILDQPYEEFKRENDFFKDNKMLKQILNYDSKNLEMLEQILN